MSQPTSYRSAASVILALFSLVLLGFDSVAPPGVERLDALTLASERGASPSSTAKDALYTCDEAEIDSVNENQDPADWWLESSDCDIPLASGNTCIGCAQEHSGKQLNNDNTTGGYLPDQGDVYSCSNDSGFQGFKGTCRDGRCQDTVAYNCEIAVIDHQVQSGSPEG